VLVVGVERFGEIRKDVQPRSVPPIVKAAMTWNFVLPIVRARRPADIWPVMKPEVAVRISSTHFEVNYTPMPIKTDM
jgi:hypothetical protein